MIDVKKSNLDIGNSIQIIKNNDILSLIYTYNSNLLISIFSKENPVSFKVDLSDGELFLLIDKLYSDLKNKNEENKIFRLFHDDIIDYHSDDSDYSYASRLIIKKNQYDYDLTITENRLEMTKNTVILSKKCSRYDNDEFFQMYENLNNYDIKTRKLNK